MSIDWDGDTIKLIMDNAPTVDPTVEAAMNRGESVYIDYTDIQRQTTSTKTAAGAFGKLLLVGGLLAVGLVLIVRR